MFKDGKIDEDAFKKMYDEMMAKSGTTKEDIEKAFADRKLDPESKKEESDSNSESNKDQESDNTKENNVKHFITNF